MIAIQQERLQTFYITEVRSSCGASRIVEPGIISSNNFAITSGGKTTYEKMTMQKYRWQTERLEPEPPSIVDCNRDILNDMLGTGKAETTAADNFETVRLVWAAYESAKTGKAMQMDEFGK